jgi:hypothetical protein
VLAKLNLNDHGTETALGEHLHLKEEREFSWT